MADGKPFAANFIAEPGKKFSLAKHDPRDTSAFTEKEAAKLQLVKATARHLRSVQRQPERIRKYFEHGPVRYAA